MRTLEKENRKKDVTRKCGILFLCKVRPGGRWVLELARQSIRRAADMAARPCGRWVLKLARQSIRPAPDTAAGPCPPARADLAEEFEETQGDRAFPGIYGAGISQCEGCGRWGLQNKVGGTGGGRAIG